MSGVRKTDKGSRAWFRSKRFFSVEGEWFFYTREGTMEGPFAELRDAENRLSEYIKVMQSGMLSEDSDLNLSPLKEKQ